MLYSTSKAQGMARDLADDFNLRFKSAASGINTVRQANDANGWPMIFLSVGGNEAEGQPVICVRIMNINPGNTDIFGNATLPFAPHNVQVAYELTSGGAPECSIPNYTTVVNQIAPYGMIFQEFAIANGTAVTEASINAATPTNTLNWIDWPNKGV